MRRASKSQLRCIMAHLRGVYWLKLKAENEGALMVVGQTLQILQESEPLYKEVEGWLCSCEKGRSWKCLGRLSCTIFCCLQFTRSQPLIAPKGLICLPEWRSLMLPGWESSQKGLAEGTRAGVFLFTLFSFLQRIISVTTSVFFSFSQSYKSRGCLCGWERFWGCI